MQQLFNEIKLLSKFRTARIYIGYHRRGTYMGLKDRRGQAGTERSSNPNRHNFRVALMQDFGRHAAVLVNLVNLCNIFRQH